MASKTISLKDEAYERLKALKTGDKSFSDVVIELTEDRKGGLEQLAGKGTDMTVEELLKMRDEEDFSDEERKKLLRR